MPTKENSVLYSVETVLIYLTGNGALHCLVVGETKLTIRNTDEVACEGIFQTTYVSVTKE